MRYLKAHPIYEAQLSNGCYAPSIEELERLPAFQALAHYLDQTANWRSYSSGDKWGTTWDTTSQANAKGVRILRIANSYYWFKINPCTNTIYYGQEKVNKDFEIDLSNLEDWNQALELVGQYSIARSHQVRFSVIRGLQSNPKRILNFLYNDNPSDTGRDSQQFSAYGLLTVEYLLGKEALNSFFVKLITQNASNLRHLPSSWTDSDRLTLLKQAGFSDEDAQGVLLSSEFGLI
jgi:hypothetical protein